MKKITYDSLGKVLIETLPQLGEAYRKELDSWGDEPPGPHNVYSDVLLPLMRIAAENCDRITMGQVATLLEKLATDPDPEIRDVVRVSVIESVIADPILKFSREFFGPATMTILHEVEDWRPSP